MLKLLKNIPSKATVMKGCQCPEGFQLFQYCLDAKPKVTNFYQHLVISGYQNIQQVIKVIYKLLFQFGQRLVALIILVMRMDKCNVLEAKWCSEVRNDFLVECY